MDGLTKPEARKAIRWFQQRLRLADWTISLCIQDRQPDWSGIDACDDTIRASVLSDVREKHADIWLKPKVIMAQAIDPLRVLFHELMHMMWADVVDDNETGDPVEHAWTRLAEVLAFAYRKGMK